MRALISNTEEAFEPGQQAWSRRLGLRLDSDGLSIPLHKPQAAEEILSLRWFGLEGEPRPQHLQTRLLGADQKPLQRPLWGPFREWTMFENELWLGPMPAGSVRVLQAPGEQVEDVLLAFIPLGADLAAGDYRLQIDLEQGRGGYLMLTLTEPGDYAWRDSDVSLDRFIYWLLALTLLMPTLAMTDELQHWLAETRGGTLRGLDEEGRSQLRSLFATLIAAQPGEPPLPQPANSTSTGSVLANTVISRDPKRSTGAADRRGGCYRHELALDQAAGCTDRLARRAGRAARGPWCLRLSQPCRGPA